MPPRNVPPMPTWREAMESVYQLMRAAGSRASGLLEHRRHAERECEHAGLSLARKADPDVAGIAYIARSTIPQDDGQRAAVLALRRADSEWQRSLADQKHWEQSWKWYADELDAHPELADVAVRRFG